MRRSLASVFVAVIVVDVPVRVWPDTAPAGRSFLVRWSTGAAPEGYTYDVQIKRPGRSWSSWLDGVAIAKATFEPDSEGRFRFRARLRGSAGGQTGWSPRATLLAT